MPPKHNRASSSTQLRSHSSTRLAPNNLQFTQPPKPAPEKSKKPAAYVQEAHLNKAAPRLNNSQHVHSKEQLPQVTKKLQPQYQQQVSKHNPAATKSKSAFTTEPADDGDDDEWESESGAVTPSHQDSDSDTASEADDVHLTINNVQQPQLHTPRSDSILPRVDTAKASDFTANMSSSPQRHQQQQRPHHQRHESETISRSSAYDDAPDSPRTSNKRYSRPPSTHSVSSRIDHALRPHPLIRGTSYGRVDPSPKPTPLAPLTVIPNSGLPNISTSPSSGSPFDGSPLSTDLPQPSSSIADRRLSFSSVNSINTIPVHSTISRPHDRTRTLSMMSTNSSSAALSSLINTHLPTRPPSPQTVLFFPAVNPHANTELIHPLLPGPYLNNHLTVLSRRTPIRESFDRVIRAKHGR